MNNRRLAAVEACSYGALERVSDRIPPDQPECLTILRNFGQQSRLTARLLAGGNGGFHYHAWLRIWPFLYLLLSLRYRKLHEINIAAGIQNNGRHGRGVTRVAVLQRAAAIELGCEGLRVLLSDFLGWAGCAVRARHAVHIRAVHDFALRERTGVSRQIPQGTRYESGALL